VFWSSAGHYWNGLLANWPKFTRAPRRARADPAILIQQRWPPDASAIRCKLHRLRGARRATLQTAPERQALLHPLQKLAGQKPVQYPARHMLQAPSGLRSAAVQIRLNSVRGHQALGAIPAPTLPRQNPVHSAQPRAREIPAVALLGRAPPTGLSAVRRAGKPAARGLIGPQLHALPIDDATCRERPGKTGWFQRRVHRRLTLQRARLPRRCIGLGARGR